MTVVRANQDRFLLRGRVTAGSTDVIINGQSAVRVGDNVIGSRKKKGINRIKTGSPTIMVNNLPMAIVGSRTTLGDRAVNGSDDVITG
jgi:uncharacterized Zn-binding protein involved in type VI secretion